MRSCEKEVWKSDYKAFFVGFTLPAFILKYFYNTIQYSDDPITIISQSVFQVILKQSEVAAYVSLALSINTSECLLCTKPC